MNAKIVPAATILMLRDGPDGLETFMVVRHHQIDFASGALVFPGGKIDDNDLAVRHLCDGVAGLDDTHCGMMVGAIREAFEETGILLARKGDAHQTQEGGNAKGGDATGKGATGVEVISEKGNDEDAKGADINGSEAAGDLISGEERAKLDKFRDPLNKGEITIGDFLAENNLRLACDRLQHFAHWITPEMMPKRFDTHFYLAEAPADHLAMHDGHESVDSVWITPEAAMLGEQDGTYTIIFPTRLNVELLGQSSTVAAAMADAAARKIVTVLPWMEQRDDGNYLCIPPEAPYSVSEEKMTPRTHG